MPLMSIPESLMLQHIFGSVHVCSGLLAVPDLANSSPVLGISSVLGSATTALDRVRRIHNGRGFASIAMFDCSSHGFRLGSGTQSGFQCLMLQEGANTIFRCMGQSFGHHLFQDMSSLRPVP